MKRSCDQSAAVDPLPASHGESSLSQPPRIMVVDDERTIRLIVRRILEKDGYAVAEAENGAVALELYREFRPHLVLLDVMMPVMDGITACTHLQQIPGGTGTPVLMVTALAEQSLPAAQAAGAAGCIPKPVDWTELRRRIRRLLEAQQAQETDGLPARSAALPAAA
jgi:CheY-like chemotaxis protein